MKKQWIVAITEEYGFDNCIWIFDGTEVELFKVFTKNLPADCCVTPEKNLPGEIVRSGLKEYSERCTHTAHWHEPDDSSINRIDRTEPLMGDIINLLRTKVRRVIERKFYS